MDVFLRALMFAADMHRDQRRKDKAASPYINHPIDVACILWSEGKVRDSSILTAAVLHDTIEDTDATPDEIGKIFGATIRSIVVEVTDDMSLPREMRRQFQVEHAVDLSYRARLVKIADKICNIADLLESPPADWSEQRKREYVMWGKDVVDKIRTTNPPLELYFDKLYSEAMNPFSTEK
ncbi:HD domain-containing protein [Candidatus Latescibacterota bacterium]